MIDVVTPTTYHFRKAKKVIEAGKHLFIEKPITETVEEAKELLKLAEKHGVKGQEGHVERFNPAFLVAYPKINNPMFIYVHRFTKFNLLIPDVSVVLDLMI